MRQQPTQRTTRARSRHDFILGVAGLGILLILLPAAAQDQVTYAIWGQAAAVRQTSDSVESDNPTAALPGVTVDEPEQAQNPATESAALPGVTIEVFRVDNGARLGTGKADPNGWYNVAYLAPLANHQVRFVLYYDFTDLDTGATKREYVGRVDKTASGDPIEVNSQSFRFDLLVPSETFIGGPAPTSPVPHLPNEFLFIEVGDIDIDDIRDQDADSLGATAAGVGLTKATALVGAPPGRSMGPDHAFGGNLEIYGLFGPASTARYYRINWTRNTSGPPPATGSIKVPLYKKNFVIVSGGVEVYRTLLGPKDVTIGSVTLTDVYELDERLVGQPIPGHPGRWYSTYWTELGLRGW